METSVWIERVYEPTQPQDHRSIMDDGPHAPLKFPPVVSLNFMHFTIVTYERIL